DSLIFLCSQKDATIDEPTSEDFYHIGTVSKIKQMLKLPGGSIRVLVEGLNRGKILAINKDESYLEAEIEEMVYEPEELEKDEKIEAAMRLVLKDFEEYITLSNKVSPD